jgi:hypothetical protein
MVRSKNRAALAFGSVIEGGEIVEMGRCDEVLARGGVFSELVRSANKSNGESHAADAHG